MANVPFADDLYELDICECEEHDAPGARLGRVVQRYYTQRAVVRYVRSEDQEDERRRFRLFATVLRAHDCAIEGMLAGWAQVQARTLVDVEGIVAEAADDALARREVRRAD